MTYQLSEDEIEICSQFEQLMRRLSKPDNVSSVGVSCIATDYAFVTAYVQDRHRSYSDNSTGRSLAERLQSALNEHGKDNPTAEERKRRRIESLRDELARLQGVAP